MSTLALFGGPPVRTALWPAYRTIGAEEKRAVCEVIDSGILSGFQASGDPRYFFGGPRVRALEAAWARWAQAKHAITVNSATSGLCAAVGAVGLEPGDEVIVTPYTMSASATAIVAYGGVPVFADIDPETFCLAPQSMRARLSPRTRGVMVVHLFGQPAAMDAILAIAKEHGLWVVEDCAQSPGATWRGRAVGTLGALGVFSLNRHKHIHTGEGGVVTTDSDRLAERVRLIRNHAEAVVAERAVEDLTNLVGCNYRMTEVEAAMGCEQLRKLPDLLAQRVANAEFLSSRLRQFPGITPPTVASGATHVYYLHALKFDEQHLGVSRDRFVDALKAELPAVELQEDEGPLVYAGYVKPLYLLPMFQQRIAFGRSGYPFRRTDEYRSGLCPVAERMHEHELFAHEYMRPPATRQDLQDFLNAFEKVYTHRRELVAASQPERLVR